LKKLGLCVSCEAETRISSCFLPGEPTVRSDRLVRLMKSLAAEVVANSNCNTDIDNDDDDDYTITTRIWRYTRADTCILPPRRRICNRRCLFVCLSVC